MRRRTRIIVALGALLAVAACADPDGYYRHGGTAGTGGGVMMVLTGAAGTGASSSGTGGGSVYVAGTAGQGGASGAGAGAGAAGSPAAAGTTGAAGSASGTAGSRAGAPGTAGAAGVGAIGPAARLSDTFEAGMTTEWIADTVNGDWAIVADAAGDGGAANKIYEDRQSDSTLSWAVGGKVTWADQVVSAKVKLVSSSSTSAVIALAVRYHDADSFYFAALKPDGTFKIRKRVMGSTNDVAEYKPATKVPLVPNTWYTLGLSAVGTTLTGTLSGPGVGAGADGGTGVGTAMATDADLQTGGIALGAQNCVAAFDDVTVMPP